MAAITAAIGTSSRIAVEMTVALVVFTTRLKSVCPRNCGQKGERADLHPRVAAEADERGAGRPDGTDRKTEAAP